MNRIANAFENKKAFIPYITAGDPSIQKTEELAIALAENGADLIEIGVPFSDPIAEGEVIQRSTSRALLKKINVDEIFTMIASLNKKIDIPIVLLAYANSVFAYGYDSFFSKCSEVGVDGIIIPDMPFEESGELMDYANKNKISVITLISVTSKDRIKKIAKNSTGFIYLVSSMGVTGVREALSDDLKEVYAEIKKYSDTPIAIGFGISTAEQASAISKYADGVIIGSAIIKIIEDNGDEAVEKVSEYAREIKKSIS